MTGLELLEALSFVDEKYIAEAETANLGRNIPWMKLLSVAACLCILIAGAFVLENIGYKGAVKEEAAAPAATMAQAPQAAETEAAPEAAAPLMPTDTAIEESGAEETAITDELYNIPYATLRIISVADDHWMAVVEELPDEPVELAVGMQVKVIIDAGKLPETDRDGAEMFGGIPLPEEGLLARIEDGAYDAGANVLYITGAELEDPAA